jgi:DNA mismatch repair protein MutL
MKIRKLSDATINRIAAGEVVEKPASVIKELVENSIDAGATEIIISIDRAGKNAITIIDNGCGMSPDEMLLAIQRHTTSKLNEDDIMNIRSFGFRGEALPSIASVSRMKITSRKPSSDMAYSLIRSDDGQVEIIEDIFTVGTKIEIKDLFFSTPARLKFLKTDATELAACLDVITKLAISHPHIEFTVHSNNKQIFHYQLKTSEVDLQARLRIEDILSSDFMNNATSINLTRDDVNVTGYISLPTYNRSNASYQYFFVNNRPIKDKLLNIALKVAYQDFLASNRHPVAVIFINIDPNLVDVNAHPAKIEVRFQDQNLIRNILINAIKDSIRSGEYRSANNADPVKLFKTENYLASNHHEDQTPALSFLKRGNFARTHSEYENLQDKSAIDFNSFPEKIITNNAINRVSSVGSIFENDVKQDLINESISQSSTEIGLYPESHLSSNEILDINSKLLSEIQSIIPHNDSDSSVTPQRNLISDDYLPLGKACAQIYETYIISQTKNDVIIIDQHAAHERLVYEDIKENLKTNGIMKQRLLIPEIVEVGSSYLANILLDRREELSNFGLTIDRFGENAIIVTETPALLGEFDIRRLIQDLAENFDELGENIALSELIEHVTETFACHHSIRAGRKMNLQEMDELLRKMERTPFSGQCNHGRPTYITISLKDIEKLFSRS